MFKELITQPSKLPTRKVAFYTAGAILGAAIPHLLLGDIAGIANNPVVTGGLPIVLGFAVAYVVRDRR